jgi:hypothetical protein
MALSSRLWNADLGWLNNPSVQEYAGLSSITRLEYRPESDILTTDSAHGSHSPLTKDNTVLAENPHPSAEPLIRTE